MPGVDLYSSERRRLLHLNLLVLDWFLHKNTPFLWNYRSSLIAPTTPDTTSLTPGHFPDHPATSSTDSRTGPGVRVSGPGYRGSWDVRA